MQTHPDNKPDRGAVRSIAIVGGGFSGTLVAVHLLRNATTPLNIHLIERRSYLGKGIAYITPLDCHLLNVPAGKMSAFADEPDHFWRWLQRQPGLQFTVADFVPRRLYGQYVQAVLQEAIAKAPLPVQFQQLQDEAIAIKPQIQGAAIELASGEILAVDRVVLALGNFPPSNPVVADPTFYQSWRYINSAWSMPGFLSDCPLTADDPVLLIGSGLTTIDQIIALYQQGHRGKILVVSRRGLLPQKHQPARSYPFFLSEYLLKNIDTQSHPISLRILVHKVRQEIAKAHTQGEDWRSIIDALRPFTSRFWQALSLEDKRRFLRHVRPYWELHRHRVAPTIAETIATLTDSGQLQVYAGCIQSYHEDGNEVEVRVRRRGTSEVLALRSSVVVNCTGSECDYRKFQHPLIVSLLSTGLIRSDALALGLEVAANGALINAAGAASEWLYTLGSPQKGSLWETTAVPEIRQQAQQLAEILL